jgi:hypothetical protein
MLQRQILRWGAGLVLLIFALAGVVSTFATIHDRLVGTRAATSTAATSGYPTLGAEAFAARAALTYLTFDSANPQKRQQALSAYISGGDSGGWDGNGRQTALQAFPSDIVVEDAHRARVTVAVLVDSGRWLTLRLAVVTDQGRFALAGPPALVPTLGMTSWMPPSAGVDEDLTLSTQLQPSLVAFFKAYASGNRDELNYFVAPGAQVDGLGGIVQFGDVRLTVYQGPAGSRPATAAVTWLDKTSGASLTEHYALGLLQVAGKWLVAQVAPAEGGS